MRYIDPLKIVRLLVKGKKYIVDKEFYKLLNDEYGIDNNNLNLPLLEFARILVKSLQYEYKIDATSDITYDLYLKLIQIVDNDYADEQIVNIKLQYSNMSDLAVTTITNIDWGNITGNVTNQTDLINYIQDQIDGIDIPEQDNPSWGDIDGDITDQEDLIDYIASQIPEYDEYILPVATTTILGGVKQGTGVTIAADGTLSASGSALPANIVYTDNQQLISGWKTFSGQTKFDQNIQIKPTFSEDFSTGYGGIGLGNNNRFNITTQNTAGTSSKYATFNFAPLTLQRTYAWPDKNGTVALLDDIVATPTPSFQAVSDVGNTTTNQIKIATTAVNTNYKLLVGGGLNVVSGVMNMGEYYSVFHMSDGRCALIADGSGIQYRLSNNDETVFPDTSKSFIWRNKGFEHMKLYSDATSFQPDGTTPATWDFKTRIKYKLYLPDIPTTTGAYKVLTRNDSTGEVETVLASALGGGSSSIYSNGLTKTGSDVKLGGPLTANTTIDGGTFGLIITNSSNQNTLSLSNNTSFTTLHASATNGTAIVAFSNSGTAMQANTNSGTGLQISAGSGLPITAGAGTSGSAQVTLLKLMNYNNSPLAGAGGNIEFSGFTDGSSGVMSRIVSTWTNVTPGTHTGKLAFQVTSLGTTADKFIIKGSGVINVPVAPIDYVDNAAALAGGLVVGDIYRTGDLLKIVHV